MAVKLAMRQIVEHINRIIDELNDDDIECMLHELRNADRIFLMGSGRSGLAVKAFAMRLTQLGLKAFVIGETITPAITPQDLFIAVSGSGETGMVINAVNISKKIGARTLAVTSYKESSLGKLSDRVVRVEGRTKIDVEKDHVRSQLEGSHSTLTPLGTLFEDSVTVFFDGIIAKLMEHLGEDESEMKKRHTSLE